MASIRNGLLSLSTGPLMASNLPVCVCSTDEHVIDNALQHSMANASFKLPCLLNLKIRSKGAADAVGLELSSSSESIKIEMPSIFKNSFVLQSKV